MKLKHMVFAGAVSFSLSSVAFAAQEAQPGGQAQDQTTQQQAQPGAQPGMQQGAQMHDQQVVRKVQEKLNEEGYSAGPTDGVWGPQTQQALTQFQQAEGLEATGQLDEQTLSALDIEEEAAQPGAQPGAQESPGILDRDKEGAGAQEGAGGGQSPRQ